MFRYASLASGISQVRVSKIYRKERNKIKNQLLYPKKVQRIEKKEIKNQNFLNSDVLNKLHDVPN